MLAKRGDSGFWGRFRNFHIGQPHMFSLLKIAPVVQLLACWTILYLPLSPSSVVPSLIHWMCALLRNYSPNMALKPLVYKTSISLFTSFSPSLMYSVSRRYLDVATKAWQPENFGTGLFTSYFSSLPDTHFATAQSIRNKSSMEMIIRTITWNWNILRVGRFLVR